MHTVTAAHHGEGGEVSVWGDATAAEHSRLQILTPFPEDAIVALTIPAPTRAGEPARRSPPAAVVMRKRAKGYFPEGGDWEYATLSAEGGTLESGRLSACARCHAEAPGSWYFGAPASGAP